MEPDSQQVADWLTRHPDFFNDHPQLAADLRIPHPHGAHAVSMSERQLITLREKIRMLEGKLAELIRFGEENDAISDKLHTLAVALTAAATPTEAATVLALHLSDGFAVPHHVLRLWQDGGVTQSAIDATAALPRPACGALAVAAASDWFGEVSPHLKSFATLPLRTAHDQPPLGLLVLASEEDRRFYPGMGTLFLERLAQLLAAAFARMPG